jgi:uncharacterized membrane protein
MTADRQVHSPDAPSAERTAAAEAVIGRLLIAVTYVAVGLLVIGVGLMIADGISPLSGGPGLDMASLWSGLLALEPAAFLWLGLLAVVAAPIGRVSVAAIAYARDGDRLMVAIALGILAVIAIGVGSALTVTV